MKEKRKLIFLMFALLIVVSYFSCKQRNDQIVNTRRFEMQLKSWSFFGETNFFVVYNNLPNQQFERETLTVIKTYNKEGQPADTLKVKMSKEEEDSIYYYSYKYLTDFKISNEEDDNNEIQVYQDGGNYSLSFEGHNYKKLEATKYNTAGIGESLDEAGKLVSFINRQVPESFRVY